MKDLLEFLIKGIIPNEKFSIKDVENESGTDLTINVKPEIIGILIGKQGKTIKALRNIVRVRATLEKKTFFLAINEEK